MLAEYRVGVEKWGPLGARTEQAKRSRKCTESNLSSGGHGRRVGGALRAAGATVGWGVAAMVDALARWLGAARPTRLLSLGRIGKPTGGLVG